jgi:hypothetical protein
MPESPHAPSPEDLAKEQLQARKAQAVNAAWRKGFLSYKLYKYQQALRKQFYESTEPIFIVKCSRRIGKSHWLIVTANEYAQAKPGCKIKYAAADAKAVIRIIKPLMEKVLQDCPKELMPKMNWNAGIITYPNGSEIQLAGCDEEKKADSLRGTDADLVILDEAGYIPILKYVVQDILLPQLLTTRGRMLIASSPAKVIGHFFSTQYERAWAKGAAVKLTIWDAYHQGNPDLTPAIIERMCEDVGGKESTAWRREFLAEDVTDTTVQVIPSWSPEAETELVSPVLPPAEYMDTYVSLDFGFIDGMGAVFGYWDGHKLRIQDELYMQQKNTEDQAKAIRLKEFELWGDRKPYLRVSDNNRQAMADLQQLHGLTFMATEKDDKELQVNNLDLLVRNRKLQIDPKCRNLISHFRTTIWNSGRTKFERDPETKHHGELIDAMVYLVRNCHRHRVNGPAVAEPTRETHRIPVNWKPKNVSNNALAFTKFFFGED